MHRLTNGRLGKALVVLAVAGVAAACTSSGGKAARNESKIQQGSYTYLAAHQPAHGMTYSPTRATINSWIDAWNKPGALAYTYLQNANGDIVGYYVLKGPPVTSCAALTPTQHIAYDNDGNVVLNNPGVDGVYYSGGQCNDYYGIDASTGSFVGFSIGLGQNILYYSQPLPRQRTQNAVNLGPSSK